MLIKIILFYFVWMVLLFCFTNKILNNINKIFLTAFFVKSKLMTITTYWSGWLTLIISLYHFCLQTILNPKCYNFEIFFETKELCIWTMFSQNIFRTKIMNWTFLCNSGTPMRVDLGSRTSHRLLWSEIILVLWLRCNNFTISYFCTEL